MCFSAACVAEELPCRVRNAKGVLGGAAPVCDLVELLRSIQLGPDLADVVDSFNCFEA